jgi:hypothetical protein
MDLINKYLLLLYRGLEIRIVGSAVWAGLRLPEPVRLHEALLFGGRKMLVVFQD